MSLDEQQVFSFADCIVQMTPHTREIEQESYHSRVSCGLTALHLAVNTGDYGVVRSLVMAGADVNARTSSNSLVDKDQTPLHFAAEFFDVDMVRLLLAAGADTNARDEFGYTPLDKVGPADSENYASLCSCDLVSNC